MRFQKALLHCLNSEIYFKHVLLNMCYLSGFLLSGLCQVILLSNDSKILESEDSYEDLESIISKVSKYSQ